MKNQMTPEELTEIAKKNPKKFIGKIMKGKDGAWYVIRAVTEGGFTADRIFTSEKEQFNEN